MVTFYTRLNQEQDNIYVNEEQTLIKIMNRTYAEDTEKFYLPFIEWIENFVKENPSKLSNLSIVYIDSYISVITSDIDSITDMAKERGFDIEFDWESEGTLTVGPNYTHNIEILKFELSIKSIA